MMASKMSPWDLVLANRYEEALAAFDARLRTAKEDDSLDIANRAKTLLCLNRLSESLQEYQRADDLAKGSNKGGSASYLETIGMIQWLLEDREEAIRTLLSAVEGIQDGSIEYADYAGGASQGLLLWYAALTEKNEPVTAFALAFLNALSKKRRIESWPGPLALAVLGRRSFDDVFLECFGTSNMLQAIQDAGENLLKRRMLVKYMFYLAASKRKVGREDECRAGMVSCAALQNPVLELEWYLARAEADRAS
jgi:hypothetical protein